MNKITKWFNVLSNEYWRVELGELYRRAIRTSGYRFLAPLITEARTQSDGYTTLALVTLGKNWVHGYGMCVKGPKDKWNENDGKEIALRRALDHAIIVLKQKEHHDKDEEEEKKIKKMSKEEIKDWLFRLDMDSEAFASAVDHRLN